MTTEEIKVTMEAVKIISVEERESKKGGTYKLVTVMDVQDAKKHQFCDRTGGLAQYEPNDIGALALRIELKRWQKEGSWHQGYNVEVIGFAKKQ